MADTTIRDYLTRLKTAKEQLPDAVNDALFSNEAKIVDLNKAQLYDGKTVKGEDIRPLYSEDKSYFKTQGQLEGYIKWKQKDFPNSKRNPDAPNLLINGYFYRSLNLVLDNGKMFIISVSAGKIGDAVSSKYKDIFGLNKEHQDKVNKEIIMPSINDFLKRTL